MPGKNVAKKIFKKKPPKKPKNTKTNTTKTNTTKGNNKTPKVNQNQDMSSFAAAKVIGKNTAKSSKSLLKWGLILAGLKETVGDWTGATKKIKNWLGYGPKKNKNQENYDADPGVLRTGGSIYTDKGTRVPGMKTGGSLRKGKDGKWYR